MARKRKTVNQLADEAQLSIDETLAALWAAGYDEIVGPNYTFGPQQVNHARRAIGMATRRELSSFSYWMKLLKLDEAELKEILCGRGAPVRDKARKLPSKAISRLKNYAAKKGIDPITGNFTPRAVHFKPSKERSFTWRTPGHKRDIRLLSCDEVLAIHFELVRDFASSPDPIEPPGARSKQLLASAVFRPETALGTTLKYTTIETSAAALLHSIIHDHPFHNGNKRTALVSTIVFLDENGLFPDFNEDEAFKLVIQVAQHQIVDYSHGNRADQEVLKVADWLCRRCRLIEKGDKIIPFRKLRNILSAYDCEIVFTLGGKLNITRTIETKRRLFRTSTRKVSTKFHYSGKGRDVPIDVIQKIRKDLLLDDQHGIDSRAFYDKVPMCASYFIARYRKTLNRLAKF